MYGMYLSVIYLTWKSCPNTQKISSFEARKNYPKSQKIIQIVPSNRVFSKSWNYPLVGGFVHILFCLTENFVY